MVYISADAYDRVIVDFCVLIKTTAGSALALSEFIKRFLLL